jgi:hypothetical protein
MMAGRFRESTAADQRTGFIVLGVYLAVLAVTSLVMFVLPLPAGFMVWLLFVLLGTFGLARWNARHSGYRCAHCGHEFEISTLTELVSPHSSGGGGWKYLRCPRCDQKSRARALVRVE